MNQAVSVVPTVLFPHKGNGCDIGHRPYINPKPYDEALYYEKGAGKILNKGSGSLLLNSHYETI